MYKRLFPVAIFILLGIITYTNSLHAPFIFDDLNGIQKNQLITQLGIIPHLRDQTFRFIPYYSFALNYHFGGWDVFGYHLVNVFIHIINAILLFYLLIILTRTQSFTTTKNIWSEIVPFTITLLFIAHPIQTQAVTFISQRLTLMATMFYLATMLLFLKSSMRKFRLIPFIGALLTMGAALLSKEISFTLPITLFFLLFFFCYNRPWKKRVMLMVPFFAVPLIAYICALIITHSNIMAIISLPSATSSLSRTEYILTQMNVIRTYIRLLFLPINQNLDYDYPIARSLLEPDTIASILLLLSIIFGSFVIYKKNKLATFGVLFFFIALSVESTFIPITDVINEHRLYLPSVGFFIFVGTGFAFIIRKIKTASQRYIATFLLFLIVIILSFMTIARNNVWNSEYSLWSDTVKKSPNKIRPRIALGISFANRNQLQEADQQLKIADSLNRKSQSLSKEAYDIAINLQLASVNERLGEFENARQNYGRILDYLPTNKKIIEMYQNTYSK